MMRRDLITINGNKLKDAYRKLAEPFNEEDKRYTANGTLYYEIAAYEQRIKDVIGVDNISLMYGEPAFHTVNGDTVVVINGKMEVYSDDGELVTTMSACGGANVVIVKDTGRPQSLKSSVDSAASEAYRNICKRFGMGVTEMREAKKKTKEGKNPEENTAGLHNLFTVVFRGGLNSGKRNYKAEVVDKATGEVTDFILFESEYPLIENIMPLEKFIRTCTANTEFSFIGEKKKFRDKEQLVFRGLADESK